MSTARPIPRLPAGILLALLCGSGVGCRAPSRRTADTGTPSVRSSPIPAWPGLDGSPTPAPVAGATVVDLPLVVRLARGRSLDVEILRARTDEALAREAQVRARLWPTIAVGVRADGLDGATQATEGEIVDVDKSSAAAGVALRGRWQPGEAVFATLAARQRTEASRWATVAGVEDVALAAGEAYLGLVRDGAALEAAASTLALAASVRGELEGRTAAGVGSPAEVLSAKAREATARARHVQARTAVRSAALRLAALLNLPPDVELRAADAAPLELRLVDPTRTEAWFVSEGLAARAEARRADSEVCAAAEERRAARIAPWVPTITVEAGSGGFGASLGDLRSRDEGRIGVEWTIGAGGLLDHARSAGADARWRQAQVGSAAARVEIVRQVRDAFGRVAAGREGIAASRAAVDEARLAEAAFRDRVRSGVAGPLELVLAQEVLQAAWLAWIDALVEHDRAQLRLLHAIGGRGT